jgi:hypothetical protein
MREIQESADGKDLPERSLGPDRLRSVPAVLSFSHLDETRVRARLLHADRKKARRYGRASGMGKCG